jgi:hypothetical protein
MAKVKLKLGLQQSEEKAVINRELRLNVTGAIYLDSENWELLTPDTVLTCEQAKSNQFKVFAISSEENINRQDCSVFDGDTWIKRLWQKPQAIGDLAGFGENLTIYQGTYNRQDEGFTLAKEVIDTGILADPPKIYEGILSLKFSSRREPDAQKHKIVWWDKSNEVTFLEIDNYEERKEDFIWESALPEKYIEPLAIAVSYEGYRLGAWWNEQWTILLENSPDPERTATLIRWFKLPILSNRYLKNVQQFALTHPQAVLQQWLLAEEPICVEGAFPAKSAEESLEKLVEQGQFNQQLGEHLHKNNAVPKDRPLYLHQRDAILKAQDNYPNNAKPAIVVTAGTGAGKTESFLLPILNKLFN